MSTPDLKAAISRLRNVSPPHGRAALQIVGDTGDPTRTHADEQEWLASFESLVERIIDNAIIETRRDFARDLEGLHIRQLEELPLQVRSQIAPLIDGKASRDDISRLITDLDARFDELPGAMGLLGIRRGRRGLLSWGMMIFAVAFAFGCGVLLAEQARDALGVVEFDFRAWLSTQ